MPVPGRGVQRPKPPCSRWHCRSARRGGAGIRDRDRTRVRRDPAPATIAVPPGDMLVPDDVRAVGFLLHLSRVGHQLVLGRIGRAARAVASCATCDADRRRLALRPAPGMAPRCPDGSPPARRDPARRARRARRPPPTGAVGWRPPSPASWASRTSVPATSCRSSCRTASRPPWWRSILASGAVINPCSRTTGAASCARLDRPTRAIFTPGTYRGSTTSGSSSTPQAPAWTVHVVCDRSPSVGMAIDDVLAGAA
jgi:hypothetical protein